MKLKAFDPSVMNPFARNNSVHIGFHHTGRIRLSKGLIDMLKLKKGDRVTIYQDEANEDEWYIAKTLHSGFLLNGKGDKHSYYIHSSALVMLIFDSMSYVEASGTCLIGQPIKEGGLMLYPIITASLKNK